MHLVRVRVSSLTRNRCIPDPNPNPNPNQAASSCAGEASSAVRMYLPTSLEARQQLVRPPPPSLLSQCATLDALRPAPYASHRSQQPRPETLHVSHAPPQRACNPVHLACNPVRPTCNPVRPACNPTCPGCNPMPRVGARAAHHRGHPNPTPTPNPNPNPTPTPTPTPSPNLTRWPPSRARACRATCRSLSR